MSTLTATSFELLLARFDGNRSVAAEMYLELRLKLAKIFVWKGCQESQADDLADVVFDRVANKLAAGEEIQNLNAYAKEVSRFVWLEHSRKRKEDAYGDDAPEIPVEPEIIFIEAPDNRMRCLRKCLAEKVSDAGDRALIVGYYDTEGNEKNKDNRKRLAEGLGIDVKVMKVKACRIRDRLEKCINECVLKLTETKSGKTSLETGGKAR